MKIRRSLVWILMILSTSCCTPKYHDVSDSDTYRQIVGKTYKALEELLIFGYSSDDNYDTISGYVITEKPGIGGREILTRTHLPIGTVIRVEKISHWTNYVLSGTQIIVQILSENAYSEFTVELRDNGNMIVSRQEDDGALMNPRLFEFVPN